MAQLSSHQHHIEFHCKAKVSDFLLELQLTKLEQKAFMSLIRKSFLSKSFLTSFSSSAILFSHYFSHVANPCSLYKTHVKYHILSEAFPDKTLPPPIVIIPSLVLP